jgi:uncharacterized protein with PIN domain
MSRYHVWMKVVGTTCVEIEANSPEEAIEKATDEYAESMVSICHQCSGEVSEPVITEAMEAVLID